MAKEIKRALFAPKNWAGEANSGEGVTEFGRPIDEQLAKINRFALSPLTADEVICFKVYSMNDAIDRDFEQFPTATVRGFLTLPTEPFNKGPIGKSYMNRHEYWGSGGAPEGRIFDAELEVKDGYTYLVLWVYMAMTDQNKNYIQQLKAGVYWAVSVGVEVAKSTCSICNTDYSQCAHFRGREYDGQRCIRRLEIPVEFIELSGALVLGAQYGAEISKIHKSVGNVKGFIPLKQAEYEKIFAGEKGASEKVEIKELSLEELKVNPLVAQLMATAQKVTDAQAAVTFKSQIQEILGADFDVEKAKALKSQATAGDAFLTKTRTEAARLYKLVTGDQASESIIKVIEHSDADTAEAFRKEYETKAEEKTPLVCPKCHEKVTRRQSTDPETPDTTKAPKPDPLVSKIHG